MVDPFVFGPISRPTSHEVTNAEKIWFSWLIYGDQTIQFNKEKQEPMRSTKDRRIYQSIVKNTLTLLLTYR